MKIHTFLCRNHSAWKSIENSHFCLAKGDVDIFFKTQSESEIEIIQLYSLGIEMKDFREIVILSAPNFINHEFLGTSLIIPSQEALILDFSIF